MTVSRRKFLAAAGGALAAPAIARPALAQAQVTLKLHHFLPPVSNAAPEMLAPWAEKVEAESGGKLKIDIFPSMQLGGTPPQLYDQARDGVVDIVWTLPGNTPGRFPSTEVFELPFIAARRGIVNAQACAGVRRRQPRQGDRATSSCWPSGRTTTASSTPTSRSRPWTTSRASSCACRPGSPARR